MNYMRIIFKKFKARMIVGCILAVIALLAVSVIVFINQASFGRTPRGERLERVMKSPNYRNGEFKNQHETLLMTSDRGRFSGIWEFIFRKIDGLRPKQAVKAIKTDLRKIDRNEEILVWFGHSSYLIQTGGKRILVDPVFCMASPVSFVNKPFKGTELYTPDDMPDIDYLVISHDQERIIELDWNENARLAPGFMIHCLPARHFSGRGLTANQSLWASFLLETPSQKIYIGGDGGYDTHYAEIGNRFPDIDLVILENGQYNEEWSLIHLMPQYMAQTARDLKAKRVLTVHHSKYALAKHRWDEPLKNAEEMKNKDSLNVLIPEIGEVVALEK